MEQIDRNNMRQFTMYTGTKGLEIFQKRLKRVFFIEEVKTSTLESHVKATILSLIDSNDEENFEFAKAIYKQYT